MRTRPSVLTAVLLLVALALVAAACSGSDTVVSEPIPDDPAATAVPTPEPDEPDQEPGEDDQQASEEEPTPEPEPPTPEPAAEPTPEPPTPEPTAKPVSPWTAEEEAVIFSGHIFWDLIVRSNNPGALEADPAYFLFVENPARAIMIDVTTETLASGRTTRGEVLLQPTSVEIDGDRAVLVECVLDAVDTLDASGAVVEPADLAPTIWESVLLWSGDRWQTSEFVRQDGTCDLDEATAVVVPFPAQEG